MKKMTLCTMVAVIALPFGVAFPQSQTGVAKAQPTPISIGKGSINNSDLHRVSLRIWDQKWQIAKDRKDGKITKEQAKSALLKLKEIRKNELAFARLNRKKEITTEQKDTLNKMLDENASYR